MGVSSSYQPQSWGDQDPSTPLSGARLTYMESGIDNATHLAEQAQQTAQSLVDNGGGGGGITMLVYGEDQALTSEPVIWLSSGDAAPPITGRPGPANGDVLFQVVDE